MNIITLEEAEAILNKSTSRYADKIIEVAIISRMEAGVVVNYVHIYTGINSASRKQDRVAFIRNDRSINWDMIAS